MCPATASTCQVSNWSDSIRWSTRNIHNCLLLVFDSCLQSTPIVSRSAPAVDPHLPRRASTLKSQDHPLPRKPPLFERGNLPVVADHQDPPSTPPSSSSGVLRPPVASVDMASPAPLLRPPIPGSRNTSASRTPKLGLAIPPSPNARPLNPANNSHAVPPLQIPPRQGPPKLSLATPMGSHGVPQETTRNAARGKLPPLQVTGLSTAQGAGSSDDSARSRSNSNGASNNYSTSTTASSYSASLAGLIGGQSNSQDPLSAAGSLYSSSSAGGLGGTHMERDGSMQGAILPDLEKLSLEKGRPLDVEDLDDAGWKVAAKESRIVELGSLGEGAGGAVNRCILKGGKTVFALKVGISSCRYLGTQLTSGTDHHNRSQPGRQEADCT